MNFRQVFEAESTNIRQVALVFYIKAIVIYRWRRKAYDSALGCAETLDPKQLNQKRLFLLTIRNGMNVLHEAEMDNVSRCRMRNSGKIRNATVAT